MVSSKLFLLLSLFCLLLRIDRCDGKSTGSEAYDETGADEYGVDFSWPMHYQAARNRILPHQQKIYEDYMDGCSERWSTDACESYEKERIEMSLNQPKNMQNYTNAGYAKIRAPIDAFNQLRQFWHDNYGKEKEELWPAGNIYTNHWSVPTKVLRLGDTDLRGFGTERERRKVIHQVQQVLESWSGRSLLPSSIYGVRIYSEGSILAPHVDRLPLVVSAIINVAQDVDEPWALELIGHDGVATNVTMETGDMILYEGHSVIHGRPYPLKGKHYGNVFIHFEPIGHTQSHTEKENFLLTSNNDRYKDMYNKALKRHKKDNARATTLPHYIKEESKKEAMWRQEYVFVREEAEVLEEEDEERTKTVHRRSAHMAAANGDLAKLQKLIRADPALVNKQDENGWQPLHEAARGGKTRIVEFLIFKDAELNKRTNRGKGATALWWAEHMLTANHPTIKLLRRNHAIKLGPNE